MLNPVSKHIPKHDEKSAWREDCALPCKIQDFIHQPCSIYVLSNFENTGGAPQNEVGVFFVVAKR